MATVLGGRSFMVVVRPALARHLSDEEARTAMEEHARAETALACEAFGPGLGACVAGEMRSLTVRMPPRPLRSPPRRVMRYEGQDVLAGGHQARLSSWSQAEHTVLDQAQLAVNGTVERSPGSDPAWVPTPFVLNEVRDNGNGTWHVAYTAVCAGTLRLGIELAGGGHINGSPFAVNVAPGPHVPKNATVTGAALRECGVGLGTFVDVNARDHVGNTRPFEPGLYSARLVRISRELPVTSKARRGGAMGGAVGSAVEPAPAADADPDGSGEELGTVDVELAEGPDGGCRVHFTLLEPGIYLLHASTGGVAVSGSPFKLCCGAGPVELSCCTVLEVGIDGEPLQRVASIGGGRLWLQTRDCLANARTGPLSQPLWCELREIPLGGAAGDASPMMMPCVVSDLGDGRVEATYPPNTPVGLHGVYIGFARSSDGTRQEHCIGRLRMDPAIRFGDESLVSAPSVIRVKPGVLFDVLVSSVDEAGRPSERTNGPLKAQLSTGPAPVALEVSDAGGGSYRVATAVQVSGEYRITFTLNGLPVAGSPITLIAPRATGRPPTASSVSTARAASPRRPNSPRGAPPPPSSAPLRPSSPRGGGGAGAVRAESPRARSRPSAAPLSQPKLPIPAGTAASMASSQRSPRSPRSVASPRSPR
jgi:hypothetical protein